MYMYIHIHLSGESYFKALRCVVLLERHTNIEKFWTSADCKGQ